MYFTFKTLQTLLSSRFLSLTPSYNIFIIYNKRRADLSTVGALDDLLGEEVSVLLGRGGGEHGGGPQVRSEERVCLAESVVDSHGQVTTSAGVASGR